MNKDRDDKILSDIQERNLEIGGILAVNMKTNKLIFVTYDAKGLVSSISEEENAIIVFGKDNAKTRAMHEITTLEVNTGYNTPKTTEKSNG